MTNEYDADFGRRWEYRISNSLNKIYNEGQFGSDDEAKDWLQGILTQSPGFSEFPMRLERFKRDTSEWEIVLRWDLPHAG